MIGITCSGRQPRVDARLVGGHWPPKRKESCPHGERDTRNTPAGFDLYRAAGVSISLDDLSEQLVEAGTADTSGDESS